MKTLHTMASLLSAVLISGVAVAQNTPGARKTMFSQGRERMSRRQRNPRGGIGERQGWRGSQPGLRNRRGGLRCESWRAPTPECLKEAGATEEQLARLKKIRDEQQLRRVDLKAAVEKAQVELKQLVTSDKPNQDAVFAAVDKVSAAKAALMKSGIAARLQARGILGDTVTTKLRRRAARRGGSLREPDQKRRPRDRQGRRGRPPVKADA